jgi:hypothetical protein
VDRPNDPKPGTVATQTSNAIPGSVALPSESYIILDQKSVDLDQIFNQLVTASENVTAVAKSWPIFYAFYPCDLFELSKILRSQ